MLDKKSNSEQYFFCLFPRQLTVTNSLKAKSLKQTTYLHFLIFKGSQKCAQNKILTAADFKEKKLQIKNSQLNFSSLNFNHNRNVTFTLKLYQTQQDQQQQIAAYDINIKEYIEKFKSNITYFKEQIKIDKNFLLEFQFFVHNSRFQLQKQIRMIRTDQKQQTKMIKRKMSQPKKLLHVPSLSSSIDLNGSRRLSRKPQGSQRKLKLKASQRSNSQNNDDISSNSDGSKHQKKGIQSINKNLFLSQHDSLSKKLLREKSQNKMQSFKKSNSNYTHHPVEASPKSASKKYLKRTTSMIIRNQQQMKAQRQIISHNKNKKQTEETFSNEKATNQKENNDKNALKSKIGIIVFILIALFIVYNAFVPNTKKNKSKKKPR